jgi:transcriptional regulator with XRE-family HTH domain
MNRATPLKLAIVASGRLQKDIAAALGMDPARLSNIVQGHWNPDDATRQAIADELGQTVSELWPSQELAA